MYSAFYHPFITLACLQLRNFNIKMAVLDETFKTEIKEIQHQHSKLKVHTIVLCAEKCKS